MPTDTTLPPHRSSLPAADWLGFFQAVKEGLELHVRSQGCPYDEAPLFVHDFPRSREGKFDTRLDVILWKVAEAQRAATDPSGRRRLPKGPQLREIRKHPSKGGYHLVTVGWWEDMLAQFDIYARSNRRASDLVVWFHRFMMQYAFGLQFFRARGIESFQFEKRLADTKTQDFGQELYQRSLQYRVRLELLDTLESKDLETLRITLAGVPEQRIDVPHPDGQ